MKYQVLKKGYDAVFDFDLSDEFGPIRLE